MAFCVMEYLDGLVKRLEALGKQCVEETVKELIPQIVAELKEIHQSACDEFYGAFSPGLYGRTEGMRGILVLTEESNGVHYEFNDGAMTTDRAGNSLYEKVFRQGYHGGGGSPPKYRKYPPNMTNRPWGMWSRPAVQTTAPLTIFIEKKEGLEQKYSQLLGEIASAKLAARASMVF